MGTLSAYMAALWEAFKQFYPLMTKGFYAGLGAAAAIWRDDRKLIDQYRDIVDEERKLAAKPVVGAAGRLRNSKFNRSA